MNDVVTIILAVIGSVGAVTVQSSDPYKLHFWFRLYTAWCCGRHGRVPSVQPGAVLGGRNQRMFRYELRCRRRLDQDRLVFGHGRVPPVHIGAVLCGWQQRLREHELLCRL